MGLCNCTDPGCSICAGYCEENGTETLRRVDKDGTPMEMCDMCAENALDSGVFDVCNEQDDDEARTEETGEMRCTYCGEWFEPGPDACHPEEHAGDPWADLECTRRELDKIGGFADLRSVADGAARAGYASAYADANEAAGAVDPGPGGDWLDHLPELTPLAFSLWGAELVLAWVRAARIDDDARSGHAVRVLADPERATLRMDGRTAGENGPRAARRIHELAIRWGARTMETLRPPGSPREVVTVELPGILDAWAEYESEETAWGDSSLGWLLGMQGMGSGVGLADEGLPSPSPSVYSSEPMVELPGRKVEGRTALDLDVIESAIRELGGGFDPFRWYEGHGPVRIGAGPYTVELWSDGTATVSGPDGSTLDDLARSVLAVSP